MLPSLTLQNLQTEELRRTTFDKGAGWGQFFWASAAVWVVKHTEG